MNRRKKIVPGSLMKALMRPGGGESKPSDGDQVIYFLRKDRRKRVFQSREISEKL